ncbi:MAG: hypothetical protein EOM20_03785 [Spartobacteria bacterium]|nr:hypothetical protein [Spartobacteria bacterium]
MWVDIDETNDYFAVSGIAMWSTNPLPNIRLDLRLQDWTIIGTTFTDGWGQFGFGQISPCSTTYWITYNYTNNGSMYEAAKNDLSIFSVVDRGGLPCAPGNITGHIARAIYDGVPVTYPTYETCVDGHGRLLCSGRIFPGCIIGRLTF